MKNFFIFNFKTKKKKLNNKFLILLINSINFIIKKNENQNIYEILFQKHLLNNICETFIIVLNNLSEINQYDNFIQFYNKTFRKKIIIIINFKNNQNEEIEEKKILLQEKIPNLFLDSSKNIHYCFLYKNKEEQNSLTFKGLTIFCSNIIKFYENFNLMKEIEFVVEKFNNFELFEEKFGEFIQIFIKNNQKLEEIENIDNVIFFIKEDIIFCIKLSNISGNKEINIISLKINKKYLLIVNFLEENGKKIQNLFI